MNIIKKLKESAKAVPMPVYIAGCIVPGGPCAIAVYLAWKASRKPKQPLRDLIKELIEEERQKDK